MLQYDHSAAVSGLCVGYDHSVAVIKVLQCGHNAAIIRVCCSMTIVRQSLVCVLQYDHSAAVTGLCVGYDHSVAVIKVCCSVAIVQQSLERVAV